MHYTLKQGAKPSLRPNSTSVHPCFNVSSGGHPSFFQGASLKAHIHFFPQCLIDLPPSRAFHGELFFVVCSPCLWWPKVFSWVPKAHVFLGQRKFLEHPTFIRFCFFFAENLISNQILDLDQPTHKLHRNSLTHEITNAQSYRNFPYSPVAVN